MNRVVCTAFALLVGVASSFATTIGCASSTDSDVAGLTINCGGLTFSNFQVMGIAGNPSPVIDLDSVSVSHGEVNLTFNPNISAPASSISPQAINFMYQVSGSSITGAHLSIGVSANATIIEAACGAPIATMGPDSDSCGGVNEVGMGVVFSSEGPNATNIKFTSPRSNLYIYKSIEVLPAYPNSTGGVLTAFTQSYFMAMGGGSGVPEPASLLLAGPAMLALVWLRRRRGLESRS